MTRQGAGIVSALAVLFVVVNAAGAQSANAVGAAGGPRVESPELVTDRPDQTESAEIVPTGTVQIELGWLRAEEEGAVELETTEAPGTLVRFGVHPRLELRAAWAGWIEAESRRSSGDEDADGAADVGLGAKLLLAEERGARPRLALLATRASPFW